MHGPHLPIIKGDFPSLRIYSETENPDNARLTIYHDVYKLNFFNQRMFPFKECGKIHFFFPLLKCCKSYTKDFSTFQLHRHRRKGRTLYYIRTSPKRFC